ncbi:UNVERIFIED_CONTAM: hypothetical protein HDU68_009015 [Siphonaria sp. JEL0065]|nr:hypothetical protein HDU68_009015 [Siphonaria sp. JEL0065]
MSQTSGLIPIGAKPAAKKTNSNAFDFEISDDDLEDLLGLDTENDYKKSKPSGAASKPSASNYKASNESLSSKSTGFKNSIFNDPNVPSSRTSFPKTQNGDGPRLSSATSRFTAPDPLTLKSKHTNEIQVNENDLGAVLTKLGDMDDMDSGLFSSTGLVTKKPSTAQSGPRPYSDPFAAKTETQTSLNTNKRIFPPKDNDTWSSTSNENASSHTPVKQSYLGNLPSSQTGESLFDNLGSSRRADKQQIDGFSSQGKKPVDETENDDLLESMGLFGDKKSNRSSSIKNPVNGESFSRPSSALGTNSFSTTSNLKTNIGGDAMSPFSKSNANKQAELTFKSGFSDSFKEVPQQQTLFSQQPRSSSPTSIKSKEEDFIPSFLAEASSGRRRRGPAATGDSIGSGVNMNSSETQKSPEKDLGFLNDNQLAIKSIKKQNEEADTSSIHKKNPLISSVTFQLSRNSNNYGNLDSQKASVALPFLEPKSKVAETVKPFESVLQSAGASFTPKLGSTASISKKPIVKQAPQQSTLSKSSSLSSLVSLSPSDDEGESSSDNENLSLLKEKKKHQPKQSANNSTVQVNQSFEPAMEPIPKPSSTVTPPNPTPKPVGTTNNSKHSSKEQLTSSSKEIQEDSKPLETKLVVDLKQERDALSTKLNADEALIETLEYKNQQTEVQVQKLSKEVNEDNESIKVLKKKLLEAEAQILSEKSMNQMLENLKQDLLGEHAKEIQLMKETHSLEIGNAIKLEKQMMAETVKMELMKAKAEHEKTIAQLKSNHFDEMAKLISTADAAQQLETLTNKMQESSQRVDEMHHKLERDHSYSVKEREMALQLKERQIVELQRQVMKQNQSLDEERQKLKSKSEATDALLDEFRREREDDQRAVDEERRNLENQISIVRTERDLIQRQLHRERLEFTRQKEAWTMERKKALMASSDEQKSLAMEKAILDAKRDAVVEIELEMGRLKGREEAQIHAERMMLDKEAHSLAIKKSDLHRETAELRAEKIAFEAEKQKLVSEKEAFEKGWLAAENRVKQAKEVQSSAAEERQRAAELDAEVRNALHAMEAQRHEIEESKKNEIQRPVFATTQKLLQTVNAGIQKASSTASSSATPQIPKRNIGVLHKTQASKPTLIPKQSPALFEAAKIQREIEETQRAKKIAMTLKRYATDLKENNAFGFNSAS